MLTFLVTVLFSAHLSRSAGVNLSCNGNNGSPPSMYEDIQNSSAVDSRTIWNIVWSCLTMLFACTWISVHPNVPPTSDGQRMRMLRRLVLMLWSLVAPELVLLWAARQWLASRRIAREYKDRNWTEAHGFLLAMGGLYLREIGKPIRPLFPAEFKRLVDDGSVEFPEITKDDVTDKSKGDGFAKAFVLLQVGWFIAQCCGRAAAHLFLTELELATLAFAMLNGFMYFFWWNKPLDLQSPFRVYLKSQASSKTPIQNESGSDRHHFDPNHDIKGPIENSPTLSNAMTSPERDTRSVASHTSTTGTEIPQWFLTATIPFFKIYQGVSDLTDVLQTGDNDPASDLSSVPRFYAPPVRYYEWVTMMVISSFLGAVFGAIHLVAWSFHFPTSAERNTWRICSLIITGLPFIVSCFLALDGISTYLSDTKKLTIPPVFISFLTYFWVYMSLIGIIPYIAARLILIVLAFTSLRRLPASALLNPQWTSFIPHLS